MPIRITASHAVPSRERDPRFNVPAPMRGAPTSVLARSTSSVWPILYSDVVTVRSGGEQAFRSEAYKNNTGRAIELHSMRAVVHLLLGGGFPNLIAAGFLLALDIQIDGVPMTRGAVPLAMMCRSDNRADETTTPYDDGSEGGGGGGGTATKALGPTTQTGSYVIYFSHPIPLGAGKTITVRAQHLGVISQDAMIRLSFAGRVSPSPVPRRIPYIMHWASRAFSFDEAATDSSPPAALVNDTGRDLNVVRMIGRSITYDSGPDETASPMFTDFDDASVQGVTSLQARFTISQDRPILKSYTPWRTVFGQNAALETDFALKHEDYIVADVKHIAGPVITNPATYSQTRGLLALVGWREV